MKNPFCGTHPEAHPADPDERPDAGDEGVDDGFDSEGENRLEDLGRNELLNPVGLEERLGEGPDLEVDEGADGEQGVVAATVLPPELARGYTAAAFDLGHRRDFSVSLRLALPVGLLEANHP